MVSKTPDTIVLCYPTEERHRQQIADICPKATLIDAGQENIANAIMEADVFFGHAKVPVDWDTVVSQGRLRWIQSSAAGLDHCLTPSVIKSDIIVSSASGLFANQVAEQTLALLLGLLRGLPTFFRQAQKKEFVRRPTGDLYGKTVGIVGLGGNGRRLAQVLKPFNVTILATDYFPVNKPAEVTELWQHTDLGRLAEQVDILILALPLNDSTQGLIDASIFQRMKRGSVFINVARGQVVCESDLVEALKSGHLSAAGVDVTEVEPLPENSPLWDMPNVIITPHVGAQSAHRADDTTNLICENLRRYLSDRPLLNHVEKKLGFPHPDVMATQA